MESYVPRVAAVHDLSCVGRCALTVIIPVLSTMGVQVCPLPTAVLSSHPGGFSDWEFCDFTAHMPGCFKHWQSEGITFDCIYSGFLASEQQIEIVERFIRDFSANAPLVVVDPVMGDNGTLYSLFTAGMREKMRTLVSKAAIITPNYTEACFLLDEPYREPVEDLSAMRDWLVRLAALGPFMTVMTGIPFAQREIVTLGYDSRQQAFYQADNPYIPAAYPGTGDIFSSVLVGALLQNQSLPAAMQLAAAFVFQAIEKTRAAGTPQREGVLLEAALPWLYQNLLQQPQRS